MNMFRLKLVRNIFCVMFYGVVSLNDFVLNAVILRGDIVQSSVCFRGRFG